MSEDLARPGSEVEDPRHLVALGRAALADRRQRLVFDIAGAGLRHPHASPARFLMLRARSMPESQRRRRHECAVAAVQIARRQRDMELVSELIETARRELGTQLDSSLQMDASPSDREQADEVVRRERDERQYPESDSVVNQRDSRDCPCARCAAGRRSGRGGATLPFLPFGQDVDIADDELDDDDDFDFDFDDDDFDDDDFDDDDDDSFDLPFGSTTDGMPPDLAAMMVELNKRFGKNGKLPDPSKLKRLDPELYARLELAMIAAVFSDPLVPPGAGGARSRRGGGRKRQR